MPSSKARLLVEAVGARIQASVTGSGYSGLNFSDANRTIYSRVADLPQGPPVLYVYSRTHRTARTPGETLLGTWDRTEVVRLDAWHGGTGTASALHLLSIDLREELLDALQNDEWLGTVQTSLNVSKLEMVANDGDLFPGGSFALAGKAVVSLALTFAWRKL